MPYRKRRVFISFDFDNDKALENLIIGQFKNPNFPFEVVNWSMKEAAPEWNWEAQARERIKRSDTVLVLVGPKTYGARGVLKEIKIARELGKDIFQMIGYKDIDYTSVPGAGRLYRWNWENLKKLLAPVPFASS